jgi:EmrB/QacA subfamily drug resistance transporter
VTVSTQPLTSPEIQPETRPAIRRPIQPAAVPVRPRALLAVLSLAGTSFAMMQALVIPALPKIQAGLGTNADGAAWISTAYLLSASVLTPVIGRLGDTIGKKRMMMTSLIAFAAGTLVCALAANLTELVAGRVIQGAAGGIYPLAFAIIRERLPRERVPASIGLVSSLLGIGGGLGLVLPGPVMQHLSYRWLFWLSLIVIAATNALAARYIPADDKDSTATREPIPWRSSLLMALGLSAILIAVSEHWDGTKTPALLALGAAALGAWVRSELRGQHPLVNMSLMRLRGVWTANAGAMLLGIGMYASFIIVPEFVQAPGKLGYGFGASVTAAGLFMFPTAAVQLLLGPASGFLHRRFGPRAELIAGQAACAAGFAFLAVWHNAPWQVYAATTTLGVGFCLCLIALPNQVVAAVPQHQTGSATAVNTVVRNVGGALGGQLAAALIVASAHAGLPAASGYVEALAFCAGATVLGAITAIAAPRT